MTTTNDPRANGFNYGAAMGTPHNSLLYAAAMELQTHLGDVMLEYSKREHDVSEATRNVRIACNPAEQAAALVCLKLTYDRLVKYAPISEPAKEYSFAELAGLGLMPTAPTIGTGHATRKPWPQRTAPGPYPTAKPEHVARTVTQHDDDGRAGMWDN